MNEKIAKSRPDDPNFRKYLEFVKQNIQEAKSGLITDEQIERVARMKWQQMTEQERNAYSKLETEPEVDSKYKQTKQIIKQPEAVAAAGPPPPKKPINAFLHFKSQKCKQIAEEDKITNAEAVKKLGTLWSKMSDAEKKPYSDLHDAEDAKYQEELQKFKQQGGVKQS